MKNKLIRRVGLFLLAALVVVQFIQPEQSKPESNPEMDFLTVAGLDGEAAGLVKQACYDCHSNHTRFPWYASVAPISYVIDHHIEEGREHLNFSVWGEYSADKADHKLEECVEEIEEGEMPMSGYVALHSEANLSDEQLQLLIETFSGLRQW